MKELLIYLNKVNLNFWLRVVRATETDIRSLYVFRIFVGLFLLCISSPNFVWLGSVPKALFDPPVLSLANLTSGFPGTGFFLALNILMVVFALFITFGIKTRFSTFAYILLFIIGANYQFSFGKIDHSPSLYIGLLFCFSLSDWGTQLAVWPDKVSKRSFNQKCLALLAIMVCFAFFTAGFEKAFKWINFDMNRNGTGAWYYKQYDLRGYLLAPYVPQIIPFWGFKIMDFIAVAFELSPIFFLLKSKKTWKFWLITACLFHAINALVLNINFIPISIVYLAFIDFSRLYEFMVKALKINVVKILAITAGLAILFVRVYFLLKGIQSTNIFIRNNQNELNLYFSLLGWIVLIAGLYQTAVKKPKLNGAYDVDVK